MLRFVTFVDGSNLDGVLKHLNLRVDDYGVVLSPRLRAERALLGPDVRRGSPVADRPAFADLLVRRRQDGRMGPERSQGRGAGCGPGSR